MTHVYICVMKGILQRATKEVSVKVPITNLSMTSTIHIKHTSVPVTAPMSVGKPHCQKIPIKRMILTPLLCHLSRNIHCTLPAIYYKKRFVFVVCLFVCQSTSYLARIACVVRNVHKSLKKLLCQNT
jgi:hypothetical protein